MPLDTQTFKMCRSNEHFEAEVISSKRDRTYLVEYKQLDPSEQHRQGYTHGWTCDCPAFKHRGECKHIQRVKPLHCGYHEQWGTGCEPPEVIPKDIFVHEPDAQEGSDRWGPCPVCGGELVIVRCAV